jgi:hypothetical protein
MRTTINLADDVAAAAEQLRREHGLGLSEAVNRLARAGLAAEGTPRARPFRQRTHDLGSGPDVSNVAELLETLEGPATR